MGRKDTTRCTRLIRQSAWLLAGLVLLAAIAAPRASAQGPVDIQSSGPLTNIWIGENLTCQVAHTGDTSYEFFSPGSITGSCGTSVAVNAPNGDVFGFRDSGWNPVSQSAVAGSGTSQSPYQVTTVVQANDANGAPELQLTETDSYVVGNEYYRTDMTLRNVSSSALTNLRLYHAADCYLQGSDAGYGFLDPSAGSVACTQNPNDTPPALIEQFAPLTPGSHFVEGVYSQVFSDVSSQADLPGTCDCTTQEDNGMGLNWDITSLGASQSSGTYSMISGFSASGVTNFLMGPPAALTTSAPSVGATGAGFSGSANPHGLATTALFQYGLDPKYTGGGAVVYTNSTPAQSVGSDSASHAVSASVSGLGPNTVYHVRLVATNSAGTTLGPDVTFTTGHGPTPGPPTLGRTFNLQPVSGVVLIKVHGVFIPLTEATQIPKNTVINALHGGLSVTSAVPGGSHPAHDAAAKGKGKKGKSTKTQKGTFSGAIFKISQATGGAAKGLTTLTLVESAFKGAPTYATCKAKKAADLVASAAASKTLQLLHASAKGKFSTRGRFSAATVRGTKWTIADRCDGTLTHDITDSVAVTDFVRRKSIILHAGQSYLAKKP